VMHVTARPPVTFNSLFSSLDKYGYSVQTCDYILWRTKLEQHVLESQDNALFPLLHFVLDDLPTSTKAPELSDVKTVRCLEAAALGWETKASVDQELMGFYLAWLVAAGFLEKPRGENGGGLPKLNGIGSVKAVGRSGS